MQTLGILSWLTEPDARAKAQELKFNQIIHQSLCTAQISAPDLSWLPME